MSTEKSTVHVSEICREISGYTGDYLFSRIQALDNGEITVNEFTAQINVGEQKIAQAVGKLRMIDFPRWKDRREHEELVRNISGFLPVIKRIYSAVVSDDPREWRSIEMQIADVSRTIADRFGTVRMYCSKRGRSEERP